MKTKTFKKVFEYTDNYYGALYGAAKESGLGTTILCWEWSLKALQDRMKLNPDSEYFEDWQQLESLLKDAIDQGADELRILLDTRLM